MQRRYLRCESKRTIGFLFGIWDRMPTILFVSLRVEMLLKRQPAKIQYLAESGKLVERALRLPPDETSSTVLASTAVAVETWTSNLEIVARSSVEQVVIHSREELILLSCRVWRVQEFEPPSSRSVSPSPE